MSQSLAVIAALAVTALSLLRRWSRSRQRKPLPPPRWLPRNGRRPEWLPCFGPGQANIPPVKWSLTFGQWIRFVRMCIETDAWNDLARTKPSRYLHLSTCIDMSDFCENFVKPFTKGTGNSIALLMNPQPGEVELMVSHAWHGSVLETLNMFEKYRDPSMLENTRIFFCTFCMYQCEDAAPGGLSIGDQLKKSQPFLVIIRSRPRHGMVVLHSVIYEVYKRMWCVHEIDEATEHRIQVRGWCDVDPYMNGDIRDRNYVEQDPIRIQTRNGECGNPVAKPLLVDAIQKRGGFDRLDRKIAQFRMRMWNEMG